MKTLVRFSVAHPVTTAMLAAAMLLLGVLAVFRLELALLPDISFPRLTIVTRFADESASGMEKRITKPVEEALSGVRGLEQIDASSAQGISVVRLTFGWNTDIDFAAMEAREKLDLIRNNLPQDAQRPLVLKFDPNAAPLLSIACIPRAGEDRGLRRFLNKNVKPLLRRIDGVGGVSLSGGHLPEVQVEIDPGKLYALQMTLEDVVQIIARANFNTPAGPLPEGEKEVMVRTVGEFTTSGQIADILIPGPEGKGAFTLSLLATVRKGYQDRTAETLYNTVPCVGISVFPESGANQVAVAGRVLERLREIGATYGTRVRFETVIDRSRFISGAVSNVVIAALLGGLLAFGVLYYFLKSLTESLVLALSIPLCVAATLFLMFLSGITLNVISLGGLALGLGMTVDSGIVVVENIRKRRERGEDERSAVVEGAAEMAGPVFASILTSIAVFLPIVFIGGLSGRLFGQMALTVSFSLLVSIVTALSLIPAALYALHLTGGREKREDSGAGDGWRPGNDGHPAAMAFLQDPFEGRRDFSNQVRYRFGVRKTDQGLRLIPAHALSVSRNRSSESGQEEAGARRFWRPTTAWGKYIAGLMGNRGRVLLLALVLLGLSGPLFLALQRSFLPAGGRNILLAKLHFPGDMSLKRKRQIATAFLGQIRATLPGSPVFTEIGLDSSDPAAAASERSASTAISMIALRSADPGLALAQLRKSLHKSVPVPFTLEQDTTLIEGIAAERPHLALLDVSGYDEDVKQAARKLRRILRAHPTVARVTVPALEKRDELKIILDRKRAAAIGIAVRQVAGAVRMSLSGEVATEFNHDDQNTDVRVRFARPWRSQVRDLSKIYIRAQSGALLPLSHLARFERGKCETRLYRRDGKRNFRFAVGLHPKRGGSMQTIQELAQRAAGANVQASVAGLKQSGNNLEGLLFAFGLAVLLVYMVLASQFEHLTLPLVVMVALPLSFIGSFALLLLAGCSINVISSMGMIMLAGIAVNNAIVLQERYAANLTRGFPPAKAATEAAEARTRPILMTTCTTLLGLLPLAVGGASLQRDLAVAVVGGLASSTLLTLIVIPVLFSTFHGKGMGRHR